MIQLFTKKRRKGFTLIELIVVIAILGILAAIAIPRLGGFRTSAETVQAEANERTIESAVQMYIGEHGSGVAYASVSLATYFPTGTTTLPIPGNAAFDITKVKIEADGSWSQGS